MMQTTLAIRVTNPANGDVAYSAEMTLPVNAPQGVRFDNAFTDTLAELMVRSAEALGSSLRHRTPLVFARAVSLLRGYPGKALLRKVDPTAPTVEDLFYESAQTLCLAVQHADAQDARPPAPQASKSVGAPPSCESAPQEEANRPPVAPGELRIAKPDTGADHAEEEVEEEEIVD